MKTATIRELHMNTGNLVRASLQEKILITERGRPVAILKGAEAAELVGKPFPIRDRRKMPRVKVDSTIHVSADRDGR
jgi:antitoxin (DNA-binding transcriptional repressor) of toxin-antitoxin stability system